VFHARGAAFGRCVPGGFPVAAVSDRRARLPGSPKRKLREYASLHRKTFRIPSACASGFPAAGMIVVPSTPV
jgi:hypothetical protein